MKVIGHKKQWDFLKKSFQLGKIPHALLFLGQEKLGKRTLALEFIKSINCQNKNIALRPCQECIFCQQIDKGIHPDFIFIEPIKKQIQISQIRDLSAKLATKPSLSTFKSAIIDQAHSMTFQAQSCFLKTLEEPKGKTILILITGHPHYLLPTILSRVQSIKFYPVKKQEIENYLVSRGLSEEKAKELSLLSFGKPGRAIDFLLNPVKLENQKQIISDLIRICDSPLSYRFQYLKDLSFEPDSLKETLEIWLTYFRNKLLEATSKQQLVTSNHRLRYSLSRLKRILQLIEETIFYILTTNINPKLALENLILEL